MLIASSLVETFQKSQDAVALQIKERGALPMIDRGDIRQAIDRCSNIWASLPGAGYGQFEHGRWQPDCKIQRSGRNGQRLMYEQSHRDGLRFAIRIIVCLSWAVNHYRDECHYLQSPARQKCQRTEAGERGNYRHADASAWCYALDAKYTKELADAKAENDALRDDAAAGRRWLHIKAVCQSREATTRLRRDNAASPRLADTAERDYFLTPSERGWSLCKNNWKEPRSILMSSADRVAHIDGQLMQLLWAIHTRFQRSINA